MDSRVQVARHVFACSLSVFQDFCVFPICKWCVFCPTGCLNHQTNHTTWWCNELPPVDEPSEVINQSNLHALDLHWKSMRIHVGHFVFLIKLPNIFPFLLAASSCFQVSPGLTGAPMKSISRGVPVVEGKEGKTTSQANKAAGTGRIWRRFSMRARWDWLHNRMIQRLSHCLFFQVAIMQIIVLLKKWLTILDILEYHFCWCARAMAAMLFLVVQSFCHFSFSMGHPDPGFSLGTNARGAGHFGRLNGSRRKLRTKMQLGQLGDGLRRWGKSPLRIQSSAVWGTLFGILTGLNLFFRDLHTSRAMCNNLLHSQCLKLQLPFLVPFLAFFSKAHGTQGWIFNFWPERWPELATGSEPAIDFHRKKTHRCCAGKRNVPTGPTGW